MISARGFVPSRFYVYVDAGEFDFKHEVELEGSRLKYARHPADVDAVHGGTAEWSVVGHSEQRWSRFWIQFDMIQWTLLPDDYGVVYDIDISAGRRAARVVGRGVLGRSGADYERLVAALSDLVGRRLT